MQRQLGLTGTTLNFLKLAAKNRRLSALPEMIKAYATILATSKGEIAGEVTSAEPLYGRPTLRPQGRAQVVARP